MHTCTSPVSLEFNLTEQQALPTGSCPRHPRLQAMRSSHCLFLPFKDILISTLVSV